MHERSDNEFYQLFLYVERTLSDPYSAVETPNSPPIFPPNFLSQNSSHYTNTKEHEQSI